MGSVFYLVLNMSITASAIGAVILLLRLLLRGRLPKLAQYALWALVGLRLLLPFSLPSELSMLNPIGRYVTQIASFPVGQTDLTMTNSIGLANRDATLTANNLTGTANSYFPRAIHFKSSRLASMFSTLGTVWLAGAIAAALAALALYVLTARRLRSAVPVPDGDLLDECASRLKFRRKIALYSSDAVSSPVVFGLIRPRIIIPPALIGDRETLKFVLLHELVHIRRLDNLRLVLFGLVCLHWFNPLIWLFYALSGRDMEMACDAGAVRHMDKQERKGYALALAGLASGRQPVLAAAFGNSAVRQRILGVAKYRRLTVAAVVLTVLFLVVVAVVVGTNPAVGQ